MSRLTCRRCGSVFDNMPALGRHFRYGHPELEPQVLLLDGHTAALAGHAAPAHGGNESTYAHLPPLGEICNLRDLVRRDDTAVVMRDTHIPERPSAALLNAIFHPVKYERMQEQYDEHLVTVELLFPSEWWCMFETVRLQSQATQEAVLRAAKHCFGVADPVLAWPTTRPRLRELCRKHAPDRVREAALMRASIDLSAVGLADVAFEFLDPVWVWVQQAARVAVNHTLWFTAHTDYNEHGERIYGRGVEAGDAMRQAVAKCGPNEFPALISLHFDKAKLGEYVCCMHAHARLGLEGFF